jgi:mannosyl-glycoprotein endo-beta-N-acetylglucosaminidase
VNTGIEQGTYTRRTIVKRFLSGAAAVAVAGAAVSSGLPASVSAGAAYFRTTTNLNLRAQASTSSKILLTLSSGSLVTQVGSEQSGFLKVSYFGTIGWAKSEFLTPSSYGGDGDIPAYRGTGTTTSAVNMRSGAGTMFSALRVLSKGTTVEVHDAYENYFWLIRYNGQFGWIHADYLMHSGSGDGDMPAYTGMGTTTAAVNLRSGKGTSYSALLVVPKGASIELYAGPAGNWQAVRYAGKFGYIHSDYVAGDL